MGKWGPDQLICEGCNLVFFQDHRFLNHDCVGKETNAKDKTPQSTQRHEMEPPYESTTQGAQEK